MKPLPILLVASLAANALLVVVLLLRPSVPAPADPPATSGSTLRTDAGGPAVSAAAGSGGTTNASGVPGLHALAAQLRAAGHSEDVVRAAVGGALGIHLRDRARELGLDPTRDPTEFWKSSVRMTGSGTPEQIAGRRALEEEQDSILRSLFGPDYHVSEYERRRRAHGLPEETAETLHRIFSDYREMEEQTRAASMEPAVIRARLELLQKERRADIERLLTPDQLNEFDLRMGAGNSLLNRLGSFEATEAEFRALYAAQQALNASDPSIPARERNERFEPEIRRVLGETRYNDLLTANKAAEQQTRAFVEMRSFVTNYNLAPSVASEVLSVQSRFQPLLSLAAGNPSLNAAQKAASRAELGIEARRELLRILGPTAFEAYEKDKGGWLPRPETGP